MLGRGNLKVRNKISIVLLSILLVIFPSALLFLIVSLFVAARIPLNSFLLSIYEHLDQQTDVIFGDRGPSETPQDYDMLWLSLGAFGVCAAVVVIYMRLKKRGVFTEDGLDRFCQHLAKDNVIYSSGKEDEKGGDGI